MYMQYGCVAMVNLLDYKINVMQQQPTTHHGLKCKPIQLTSVQLAPSAQSALRLLVGYQAINSSMYFLYKPTLTFTALHACDIDLKKLTLFFITALWLYGSCDMFPFIFSVGNFRHCSINFSVCSEISRVSAPGLTPREITDGQT